MRNIIHQSAAVFAIISVCHGVGLFLLGPHMANDSRWYSDAADHLIAYGFNYRTYLERTDSSIPPLFYLSFVTLLAVCKKLFGDYWQYGVLAMHLVADSLVGAQLVSLVRRLTRISSAAWVALVLYLVCFDIFNWSRQMLSDATFLLVSFSIFFLIAGAFLRDQPGRPWGHQVGVAVLLLLALVSRPTSLVLCLPVAGTAILWWRRRATPDQPLQLHPGVLGTFALLAVAATLAYASVMQNIRLWPWPALSDLLRLPYYSGLYSQGEVVSARLYTYLPPPATLLDYVAISATRFFYFFAFFLPYGFSPGHNLIMAIFFVPTYALAVVGLYGFIRRRAGLDGRGEAVVAISVAFIVTFAFFHAHTEVDFDWRYRLPIIPHLILLAAVGVATWRERSNPHEALSEGLRPCPGDEAKSHSRKASQMKRGT